jgi:hypothetical protein
MDLAEPFKNEVLRPITTLVVPGTIAVGPFVLVLGDYVPSVEVFWTQHPNAFTVLLVLSVLAAGYVVDEISTRIESKIWDPMIEKRKRGHLREWREYLKLQLNDELIGQRYLRLKVTELKFELAMAPSLIIFWLGLLWLQVLHRIWSPGGLVVVTGIIFLGSLYLLWESWQTAKLLSDTRTIILEAINAFPSGPKGIAKQSGA